jgi:hypothetical protein
MRTLKLSHKQIQLILHALGMAENQFVSTHKKIIDKTINVRGNDGRKSEQQNMARYYHNLACEFADLNTDISQGKFDI